MAVISVFGDSIVLGAGDLSEGGWVNRLRKHLDSKNEQDAIYNLGVSGDTSRDVLKRFKVECEARWKEASQYKESFVIIFSFGTNDASMQEKRVIPNKEFSLNVKKLIELARKYTDDIFFLDILPVSEPKVTPVPWNTKLYYRNKEISALNGILTSICWEEQITIIKVRTEFEKANYHRLLQDGLHPNAEGHELIYKTVQAALVKHKLIK